MSENKTPRWNLDSLYKNLECDEYKRDLKKLESLNVQIGELLKSDLDFDALLLKYLELDNEYHVLLKTLNAYAYIIYSTDTTNQAYMNNLNLMEDYSAKALDLYILFSTILSENKDKVDGFLKNHPEKEEYRFLLNEIIEDKAHQMTAEEEALAAKMSHTGANAWSLLQEQLISNLNDGNGKTFNELRNDANEADPVLRQASWKKEVELLDNNRIAFAACLNNLKGETVALNKKRNWNSAIDRALFSSRLSKQSLDALIGAIEDSLPDWRRYFQAKAKLLRKANATVSKTAGTDLHPGIAFYDMFAPVEEPACGDVSGIKTSGESLFSKKWTFEEAKDYILKEYYSFSSDMGDFAKAAFENEWIDAEVRGGKVGGAYDEDFPKGHQSRVLTNFTGVFSDIITLAHELGHAYHFSCVKGQDAIFSDYPMTLAETASTFAETIVKQDILKAAEGFDKIRVLDLDLTDAAQVLVDILSRFYFERSVFEEKQTSELTADDFCRLMEKAQEDSYGCGLNDEKDEKGKYTERHNYMWSLKCHYYIPELDFYNFPYAFGQLFAAGLYTKSKEEGPEFAKTYSKLLSKTGKMSCEEVCKQSGFDITTKDFWLSGIKMYKKEIDEFCNYVNSL